MAARYQGGTHIVRPDKTEPRVMIANAIRRGKVMWRTTAAASLVLVSTVALADDKSDCLDSKDHDLRIRSCSAIIERNPKDVVAYSNRGEAHELKGEVDRAISDYTKAIVSDRNYAPAATVVDAHTLAKATTFAPSMM